MADSGRYFVEWKEQYVSKERGSRVVHYFLKDNSGDLVLAVLGTEKSVRHMFYVVSDEFLSVLGAENSDHSSFRWRSRREVVNWLTSMLSKRHWRQDDALFPRHCIASEANAQLLHMPLYKGCSARKLKNHHLDIAWSGSPWACGKQLKHYSAFRRNGISIPVQSFVFVMAEKENRYIAYLEDMYEDRKCQKKVKVRWFHNNKEVKGVISLQNPHPREVYITSYIQVISAECIDGPAIVLTREHYEKCHSFLPQNLSSGVHFCSRQFKSNRLKPFKLSKLQGYFSQPIFYCFSADPFEEEFGSDEDVKVGAKRHRKFSENDKLAFSSPHKRHNRLNEKAEFFVNEEARLQWTLAFAVNDKVEFLCQDSGMRGCWFRCTVLEITGKKMKIQYDDIADEDNGGHVKEWIHLCRVAKADKLKMRYVDRPAIRPSYPCQEASPSLEVGLPVDAWWCDGWWEGIISSKTDAENGSYNVYIPGEKLYLSVEPKNIRVSRDWVGDGWVDVEPNSDVISVVSTRSTDTKLSTLMSVAQMNSDSPSCPPSICKVDDGPKHNGIEEELHELAGMALTNVPLREVCSNNERSPGLSDEGEDEHQEFKSINGRHEDPTPRYTLKDNEICDDDDDDDENNLVECEISELIC